MPGTLEPSSQSSPASQHRRKRRFILRPRPLLQTVLLSAFSLLIFGCSIIIVSGPDSVRTGDQASFVVRVNSSNTIDGATVSIAVEVPVGWRFLRHAYVTNQPGDPAQAGVGRQVDIPSILGFPVGAVPAGFQRLFFEAGPLDYDAGDSVDVQFEFLVGGSPGTHDLRFWTAGTAAGSSVIGNGATKTVTQYQGVDTSRTVALIQPSNRNSNFFSDEEQNQRLAEDVLVSSSTGSFFLRRVEFAGLYGDVPAASFFSVAVFSDSGGLPGSLIQQFDNLRASVVATGEEAQGFPEQRHVLDLPEIVELSNGFHWVSIEDQTPSVSFSWISGDVDPGSGNPGLAASLSGGPWIKSGGNDVALRLLGSEHPIAFQDAFDPPSSMTTELACGLSGEAQVVDSCPWGLFAPSPSSVGVWGNATCTQYGTAQHRVTFQTPVVDISICPAGTQAVLEVDYLLDLEESFEFDRAFIEATVDGVSRVVATNSNTGNAGGSFCNSRPDSRGGLVNDRQWRHVTLLLGTGGNLTVALTGEVLDGVNNDGAGLLIDDLWVRCGSELFFDGFESGNTSAWGSVSP